MNKVKVLTGPSGSVINPSDNPEWGYVRVTQQREVIEDGFLRVKDVNALVHGTLKDLERLKWTENQELDGTIFFREQTLPFDKKDPKRDLKVAGKTGVVCKKGEDPIYRRPFYSSNPAMEDKLVPHTNGEEIREAYALLKAREEEEEADLSL